MSTIEYQRYTLRHLIDRLAPSTWGNLVLGAIVFSVSLITTSLTTTHGLIYFLFVVFTVLRLQLFKKKAHRKFEEFNDVDLKKVGNYFTFLIGGTGVCWSLILVLPALLDTDNIFWNQFVYFLATGLFSTALFNIGISKRNFLVFTTPILISLSISCMLTQEDWRTMTIFIFISLLFFFFMKALQRKTEEFYSEIYNRQQDMFQILEGFPGAISLVENDRYLFVNSKLHSLFKGVPLKENDEVGSHKINDNLVRKMKQFEQSVYNEQEFETELATSQGKRLFWVLMKRLQGQKIMVLSMDIEDKRNNEKKLEEQNIKLIESSKMASLGEMSSGIAHEINNPLTIIQGSTRQISRATSQLSLEIRSEIEKLTTKIDLMSLRITKIIKGLRSFAREGSNDPFDYVSIRQIIDETLFICESRFKNSDIDVRKNYSNEIFIRCRSVQISQVILNILNNAYDAIMEKRNFQLPSHTDFIDISVTQSDGLIYVKIKDTGKGISTDIQSKVLNPFFTTKGVGKGTGLGLSISKSIMEEHEGSLYFNFDSAETEVNLTFKHYK